MKDEANSERRSHFRKKRFLIYPSFQIRYIGWMVVPVLLNLAALFVLSHFLIAAVRQQIQAYLVVDGALWKQLSDAQDRTILFTFVSGGLFTSFLLVVSGLAASHRIAGPIMRLRGELRRLAKTREFKPIRFRKKDVFKELATDYNAAMGEVTGRPASGTTEREGPGT